MPRESNILVVANRTALSAGLDEALRARLAEGPATFTLIVPVGRAPVADRVAPGARTRRICGGSTARLLHRTVQRRRLHLPRRVRRLRNHSSNHKLG